MNKITFKKISYKKITDHFLNGFIRFQETNKVYKVVDRTLELMDLHFLEEWNQEKLITISRELKESVKKGSILYAAYDKKQIVGFSIIENDIFFDEYVNMAYLHVTTGYRGYGIGKYLFQLLALEASKLEAKKIYLSTHASYETQQFYMNIGCILAKKIHPKLYELEPFDVHREFVLDEVKQGLDLIDCAFRMNPKTNATLISKMASNLYQYLPKDEVKFLAITKEVLTSDKRGMYSLATSLMKRNTSIIHKDNMDYFEQILLHHIHGWGQVDQYCYRVLNPMIELDDAFYSYLLKWSDSTNKDVRRASLVSMIRSSNKLTLEYDFDRMIHIVDKLKQDEDIHVRKAVGWVLKCSYFKYPNQLEEYLRKNVSNLDRLIFRYALEHIEDPLRQELMSLKVIKCLEK